MSALIKKTWISLLAWIILSLPLQPIQAAGLPWLEADLEAGDFLLAVLDYIQAHHIFAGSLDWPAVQDQAREVGEDLQEPKEAIPFIQDVLDQLPGRHSYIIDYSDFDPEAMPEEEVQAYVDLPDMYMVTHSLAYIQIPSTIELTDLAYNGRPEAADHLKIQYIQGVHQFVHDHKDQIQGAIIDLRGNEGGQTITMLAALAPFLQEGILLYYVEANDSQSPLYYEAGRIYEDHPGYNNEVSFQDPGLTLQVPLAILLDEGTASAAEACYVALQGQALDGRYIASFGQATSGNLSSNLTLPLTEDHVLALTFQYVQDLAGHSYQEDPIQPDYETSRPWEAALTWLLEVSP